MKTLKWIGGGIAALFVVLIVIAVIVGDSEDDNAAVGAPATAVAEPTEPPEPTPDPTPGATPEPTPPPTPEPTPEPTPTGMGDGIHLVGTDIPAGTYRSVVPESITGGFCYWARLRGLSGELDDIITNEIVQPAGAQALVAIDEADIAFESSGCGQWELLN